MEIQMIECWVGHDFDDGLSVNSFQTCLFTKSMITDSVIYRGPRPMSDWLVEPSFLTTYFTKQLIFEPFITRIRALMSSGVWTDPTTVLTYTQWVYGVGEWKLTRTSRRVFISSVISDRDAFVSVTWPICLLILVDKIYMNF